MLRALLWYARAEFLVRKGSCAFHTAPSHAKDGACQAVTQGSGEQYLSAFALLLQAGPFQLCVLSALPQLIGTGAQLASVKLLQWFPDRKARIFAGTVGQAFVWIPIVLLPLAFPEWGP
ncbi:MAG: hypothetical protein ABI604_12280 [Nitrospirota bacterium]